MIIEKQEASPGYILGEIAKGGPGSGNFGHAGRPGQIGGSGGGSASAGMRGGMGFTSAQLARGFMKDSAYQKLSGPEKTKALQKELNAYRPQRALNTLTPENERINTAIKDVEKARSRALKMSRAATAENEKRKYLQFAIAEQRFAAKIASYSK